MNERKNVYFVRYLMIESWMISSTFIVSVGHACHLDDDEKNKMSRRFCTYIECIFSAYIETCFLYGQNRKKILRLDRVITFSDRC